MKTLIIKIEIEHINFYTAQSPQNAEATEIASIPLGEQFLNAGFMEKPAAFALFIMETIKNNSTLKNYRQCVLVLDNSYILSKDFTHNKTYGTQLLALAEIEMEAMVGGNVSDYVMLTHGYGNRVFLSGYYKSFLYVLPKRFLSGILKSFQKSGISLKAVVASSTAYNDFANSQKAKAENGYTAFINFGKYKTLLSIFEDKDFVYEGSFTSVYHDMVHLIANELSLSMENAEKLFVENGICNAENSWLPEAVCEKIRLLLSAAAIEVSRGANIAASVERKDLKQVVITGDLTAFPGFKAYFTDAFGAEAMVLSEYGDSSFLPHVRQTKLNFLIPIRQHNRKTNRLNVVFALLVFLTLATFMVMPLSYYFSAQLRDAAVENVQKEAYVQIKQRIELETTLERQLQTLKKDDQTIDLAKRGVSAQTDKMLAAFSKGAQILSYEYMTESGVFTVGFSVPSLEEYITIKNRMIDSNIFDIAVPFSYNDNGTINCQVSLKLKQQAIEGGRLK